MGKKCYIPGCYTGYRNCQEKHPMYGAPRDHILLQRWQEAIAREDRPLTPNDVICGKHFHQSDLVIGFGGKVEYKFKKPILKSNAVPSVFPEKPEAIHGTVKKRRKLEAYEIQYQKTLEEKWKNSDLTDDSNIASNTNPPNSKEQTEEQTKDIKTEPKNEDPELYHIDSVIKDELIIKSETNLTNKIISDKDINKRPVEKSKISKVQARIQDKLITIIKCKQCPFKGKSLKSLSLHTVKFHNIGKNPQRKSDKFNIESLQM